MSHWFCKEEMICNVGEYIIQYSGEIADQISVMEVIY